MAANWRRWTRKFSTRQSSLSHRWNRRLKLESRADCLGCHGDLEEFVRRTARQQPDVVVFGAAGLDAAAFGRIRLMKRVLPETPMLVLTLSAEHRVTDGVLRNGVRGCLPEGCAASELAEAVRPLAADSYKTAWVCLHKLRSCLERVASEPQEKLGSSRFETFKRLLRIAAQTPDQPGKQPDGHP